MFINKNFQKNSIMLIKKLSLTLAICVTSLLITNTTMLAADSSDNEEPSEIKLDDADFLNGKREAYNGNLRAAIVYLERSIENNSENPDAYNLLGYSNRKISKNDEAFTYYYKALEIDPRHKGTHEYIGKLFLNLRQPDNAKKHLAKLDSICFFGCDEYTSLKEAIEEYGKSTTYKKY
jgi:tetratricopeptide (TPR) repeat protein